MNSPPPPPPLWIQSTIFLRSTFVLFGTYFPVLEKSYRYSPFWGRTSDTTRKCVSDWIAKAWSRGKVMYPQMWNQSSFVCTVRGNWKCRRRLRRRCNWNTVFVLETGTKRIVEHWLSWREEHWEGQWPGVHIARKYMYACSWSTSDNSRAGNERVERKKTMQGIGYQGHN